ncbi:Protein CHLOROPLAST IMPORT APPARATUS 2 [Hirschfeldia incana]|nr:Protein CHLOROPLAST IMPORT APPARATUS 2 [Hirschfeldia incana]
MSACLSSGGSAAAYSFELEKIKSPPSSSTTTITRATSPSSTITESSNSPLAISTRKPRTQRKRPNQNYNEAAALLSSAYPNIFSPSSSSNNNNNYMCAKKKTHHNSHFYGFDDEDAELLLPFESIEEPNFMFNPMIQAKSEFYSDQKEVNSGVSVNGGGGIDEAEVSQFEFSDEFDAESILGEETEEGIDSIMGSIESEKLEPGINRGRRINRLDQIMMMNKGFKFAENIPLGLGLRSALREHNAWRFHTVDFEQISPRVQSTVTVDEEKIDVKKPIGEKSKKKKKKVAAAATVQLTTKSSKEETEERSGRPMLRLDYDGVLEAWSDKATPFGDEILGSEATGADVNARLAQIDLFGDSGVREASVLRYKEKRQNRLFSKKIRYQVRKLNADQRPRVKVSSPTLIRG